jgi:hypothetical protein
MTFRRHVTINANQSRQSVRAQMRQQFFEKFF